MLLKNLREEKKKTTLFKLNDTITNPHSIMHNYTVKNLNIFGRRSKKWNDA